MQEASDALEPLQLYRSILSAADDHSITLIVIGFLTNVAELLRSPADEFSNLEGSSLIMRKVTELVIMGGKYPSGKEWNFVGEDPASTKFAIDNWPSDIPITFLGYEFGHTVVSGAHLRRDAPHDSPVLAAYEWYITRCQTASRSYDPLTVLYGVLGIDGHGNPQTESPFEYANENGYNEIAVDGTNAWVEDPRVTNRHWLRLKAGWSEEDAGSMLDVILSQDGTNVECADLWSRQKHIKSEL